MIIPISLSSNTNNSKRIVSCHLQMHTLQAAWWPSNLNIRILVKKQHWNPSQKFLVQCFFHSNNSIWCPSPTLSSLDFLGFQVSIYLVHTFSPFIYVLAFTYTLTAEVIKTHFNQELVCRWTGSKLRKMWHTDIIFV